MVEDESSEPQTETTGEASDLQKTLENLRPLTEVPPPDQLPKGVSAETFADLKNLTDLMDIVKAPINSTPTPSTTKSPTLPTQPST